MVCSKLLSTYNFMACLLLFILNEPSTWFSQSIPTHRHSHCQRWRWKNESQEKISFILYNKINSKKILIKTWNWSSNRYLIDRYLARFGSVAICDKFLNFTRNALFICFMYRVSWMYRISDFIIPKIYVLKPKAWF